MKQENSPWVIKDISETDSSESREALLLESEGASAALAVKLVMTEGGGAVLPPVLDLMLLSADDFLAAVRGGEVESRGGKKKGLEIESQNFLRESLSAMGTSTAPAFLKSVASSWARLSQGRADEEITRRIARDAAKILASLWRLGHAGGLTHSILSTSLHRLDVRTFLRVKGWLAGEARRLADTPPVAALLEKNQGTILARALKTGDPSYGQKAAKALPEMIKGLEDLVARMRESQNPRVREAADLLGGGLNTRWRGNVSSVVNHAIASGRLQEYVREVERRFIGGDILKDIEEGVRDLGETTDEAILLKNNRASIISRALHHGRLDYRPQWRRKLQNVGVSKLKKLQQLENENRRLKNLVADLTLDKHAPEEAAPKKP